MNEERLRAMLREEPIPHAADAERRSLRIVEGAYTGRRRGGRPVLPRLAVALAAAALLAALLLSPAGAAVRGWIDDVFTAGVRHAEPALTEIPAGGELLVQTPAGPWAVRSDGARRLLGDYAEATWSPHGLFVATAAGRTLSAVEPDGTPRWSLTAGARVGDPRWSPSGFRIAYRAGRSLRVVSADGSDDRLIIGRSAPIAPAWFPPGLHLLAYIDAGGRLRVANVDSGATVAPAVAAPPGARGLSWAADGTQLLQSSRDALWLRRVGMRKLAESLVLGPARRLRLPAGAEVLAAAFAPHGHAIAALLQRPTPRGGRDEVVVLDPEGGPPRRLLAVAGGLSGLAWSPDGSRLLVGWPAADQWLFLPLDGGRVRAVGGIASAFSPGGGRPARFPRIDGWCCTASPAGAG